MARGLTDRQQLFIDAYVANGGNGLQAALLAGYEPTRARQSAYDLLKNPRVIEAVLQLSMSGIHLIVPAAIKVLTDIALDVTNSATVRYQAAEALLKRGMPLVEKVEVKVNKVPDAQDLAELRAAILADAEELGIAPSTLEPALNQGKLN